MSGERNPVKAPLDKHGAPPGPTGQTWALEYYRMRHTHQRATLMPVDGLADASSK